MGDIPEPLWSYAAVDAEGPAVTWALVPLVTVVAAWAVRHAAHTDRARRLSWLAAAGAAVGAGVAVAQSPVPVAAAVAAAGLGPAAVIDGAEGRIPTAVAHGTTGASLVLLLADGVATGEWDLVLRAIGMTAALVAGFVALWLAGGMGFGDVRMAAATVTAMTRGFAALLIVLWVAFFAGGVIVVGRRLFGRRRAARSANRPDPASTGTDPDGHLDAVDTIPFGPALAIGWLVAVATS